MIKQMFQRVMLELKHDNRILLTYFVYNRDHTNNVPHRNVNTNLFSKNKMLSNLSNDQNDLRRQEMSSSRQIRTNILKGSQFCKNNALFLGTNSVNCLPVTVNRIRQFSSSTAAANTDVFLFQNMIFNAMSKSAPVELIMDFVKTMHSTGLPWWTTIMLSTVCLQTFILLPLNVYQHQIQAKISNLKHEFMAIQKKLQMERSMAMSSLGWSGSYAASVYQRSVREEWNNLVVRENCHPVKIPILSIIRIPILLCCTTTMRNLCFMLPKRDTEAHQVYLEFVTGGFGWITDLTTRDPSFILPIIFGLCNHMSLEIHRIPHLDTETTFRRRVHIFLKIFNVGITLIFSFLPSGLLLFWTTTSFLSFLQALLFLSPKFRRLIRIPKTESELDHPYLLLLNRLKTWNKRNVK